MIQKMVKFTLLRKANTLNEWNEQVATWKEHGKVRVAVSLASGSANTLNQLLRIDSTHTGITYDDIQVGDRFGGYQVLYVTDLGRKKFLNLKRDDAAETVVEG